MKHFFALLLALLLLFSVSLVGIEAIAEESDLSGGIPGFVISDDEFFSMADAFFQGDFADTVSGVTLSETQSLAFNPTPSAHLLPALAVTVTETEPFVATAEAVAATLGSLMEVVLRLQDEFPDAFLFNKDIEALHADAGISYAVAEPDIWLWPEATTAVVMPVCFYENDGLTMVDGMYLLEAVLLEDGSLRYLLYNNPSHVVSYMTHVTISSDNSPFQRALALWYVQLQTFGQDAAENPDEDSTVNSKDIPTIGMLRIISNRGNIRASNDASSRMIVAAKQGEEYPVFAVMDNGWYQVLCENGQIGYIASSVVAFFPKPKDETSPP